MSTTLKELIEQRHALDAQINEIHKTEKANAVASIKSLIAEFDLTKEDIFGGSRATQSRTNTQKPKVQAKFRDPATGKEWSGRGLAPKWIAGKDREAFRIAAAETAGQPAATV